MIRDALRNKHPDKMEQDIEKIYKKVNFHNNYDSWYSKSLAVIKQILPNREDDFINLYKRNKNRKTLNNENYVIQDFLDCITVSRGLQTIVDGSVTKLKFKQQLNILKSAKERFTISLFDIKSLCQADLLDSEVDIAKELLKKGFIRASGAVLRVVLEKHLAQICNNSNIAIKKNPTLNDFADNLKKNDKIDITQFKLLQYLADITNLCCHNKEQEPSKEDLKKLINGVNEVLKTYF